MQRRRASLRVTHICRFVRCVFAAIPILFFRFGCPGSGPIASGAWAGRVADLFGQPLPVLPERHEAVTIRLPEPLAYVMPMVMDLVYGGGGTGLNFRHDRPGQLVTEIHKSTGAEGGRIRTTTTTRSRTQARNIWRSCWRNSPD